MNRIYLNERWVFTSEFTDGFAENDGTADLTEIRIPHTVKETPFHYFSEDDYQMISGYRRLITIPQEWEGKRLLLTFEGAAHDSTVYVNGREVGAHHCGYTAFTCDISEAVHYGAENRIVVRLDSNETLNVPPFGYVIDYMTYGGIYRDVYLEVKSPTYISDSFHYSEFPDGALGLQSRAVLVSQIEISGEAEGLTLRQSMRAKNTSDWQTISEIPAVEAGQPLRTNVGKVDLWTISVPALYEIRTELLQGDTVVDSRSSSFGFREAVFAGDGFYLNGRKIKIRGLNRHQSYAYVGYAMPDSMQIRDAEICKNELGLNAVRTSHYPQSQAFIDRCDELGLLVFTEFPGWQHIGDEDWQEQCVENTRDMILQYRNHPSIVLWGVRINESVDNDALYSRTNALAWELDPSRQTGGVRCTKKGSFLEDVYTYNDFVHSGDNRGCDKKSSVSPDMDKAYFISEYNGHMFPTKTFDCEEHRMEHALRHANVLNDVTKNRDIAGSFGWCMFDYNTHKDFGSGDRICYHGVMDMFRNPKMAASVYASQQNRLPVFEISSSMDIGEHPASVRGKIYAFTNADSVRFYKNNVLINEFYKHDSPYKYLAHGPILIDDLIGDRLEREEGMPHDQAEVVKRVLNETALNGMGKMSLQGYLSAARGKLRYGMTLEDATRLFNEHIGDWGGQATAYRFDAIKDGKVVGTIIKAPMNSTALRINVDHTDLKENKSYDVAAVRIKMVDEYGNVLPFANEPLMFSTEGDIELIGPSLVSMQGGMFGTYVRSTGKSGSGRLTIQTADGSKYTTVFTIDKTEASNF